MVDADKIAFRRVYRMLGLALQARPDRDPLTWLVYYRALRDLPYEHIAQAAACIARGDEGGAEPRRWFPTTAEWHRSAQAFWQEARVTAVSRASNGDEGEETPSDPEKTAELWRRLGELIKAKAWPSGRTSKDSSSS